MDRIEPIRPGPPAADRIPSLQRGKGAPEKERGDRRGGRRRDDEAPEEPVVTVDDDGRPHIDVRV